MIHIILFRIDKKLSECYNCWSGFLNWNKVPQDAKFIDLSKDWSLGVICIIHECHTSRHSLELIGSQSTQMSLAHTLSPSWSYSKIYTAYIRVWSDEECLKVLLSRPVMLVHLCEPGGVRWDGLASSEPKVHPCANCCPIPFLSSFPFTPCFVYLLVAVPFLIDTFFMSSSCSSFSHR